MTGERGDASSSQLEGLILCDAAGALYEVPCVVIERYRVLDERRSELDDVVGFAAMGADEAGARHAPASWVVHGAIYSPAADRPPPHPERPNGETKL